MLKELSSVFSGLQWDRRDGYRRKSWWGKGQTLYETTVAGELLLGHGQSDCAAARCIIDAPARG